MNIYNMRRLIQRIEAIDESNEAQMQFSMQAMFATHSEDLTVRTAVRRMDERGYICGCIIGHAIMLAATDDKEVVDNATWHRDAMDIAKRFLDVSDDLLDHIYLGQWFRENPDNNARIGEPFLYRITREDALKYLNKLVDQATHDAEHERDTPCPDQSS